jgi:epidermal growth factor receptor substrate 15
MKYKIVFLFLLLGFFSFAQNLVYRVGGKITNSDTKKNEAGVTISFVSNGKTLSSVVTSTNGKYDLKVEAPLTGVFMIVYSKPGLVTKKISFNGTKMNAEDIPTGAEFPLPTLDMDLFSERPTADFSFLNNEPVASFFWNESKMLIDYDRESSAKVRKKIDDLLAQEQKQAQDNEAKYRSALNAGQLLFSQKKYDEALVKYKEASKLKPTEQLPISQIDAIDKILIAQKNQNAAAQQLENEYKNLITAADNLRNQNKLEDAIKKYREALTKKDDAYPKSEIAKLTTQLNNQKAEQAKNAEFEKLKSEGLALVSSKNWNEAKSKLIQASKIKDDLTVNNKIKEIDAEIEKEKANAANKAKYDLAILTAEGLLTSQKYLEAKSKFQEASTLDPSQQLPKQKITQIDGLILKKQQEKELQAKISKLITDANSLMIRKDLNNAKIKYEEVLKLDSKNTLASGKLKQINNELNAQKGEAEKAQLFNQLKKEGFDLATAKKYNEAKLKLEQAIGIKSDISVNQKLVEINKAIDEETKKQVSDASYNKIIEEASNFEASNKYELAIAKYKAALKVKPSENLPKSKITALEKLLGEQANKSQQDAQNLKLYNTHILNGDKNLSLKNYDLAISEYQKALGVKPGDSYASSKISEANQLKDNLKQQQTAVNTNQIAFDKFMTEADKLFKLKKYLEAKKVYESALGVISTDARAIAQVKECIRLESAKSIDQADEGYRKLLGAADKKFNEKDYLKAKEYYERALGIKSTDSYPKRKLDEIEVILNPKVTKPIVAKVPVVLEPEKLQLLGEPYSKSIMYGEEDLKKAELARKKLQKKKLEDGVDNVNDKSEEFINQKKSERETTTKDVNQIQLAIEEENSEKGKEFQAIIENNKKVRKQQKEYTDQSNLYENTDRLHIQEKTDIIKLENDYETNEKIAQYLDKGEEMKSHNTQYSNETEQSFLDKKDQNMTVQEGIVEVQNEVINKQEDDKQSRVEVEDKIRENTKEIYQKNDNDIAKASLETKQIKYQINEADKKMSEKALNDAYNASDITVDLREVKSKVNQSVTQSTENATDKGRETSNSVVELNKSIESEKLTNDDNLKQSSQNLRNNSKDLYNNSNDVYNQEKSKNIQSKDNIHRKLNKIEETTISSNEKLIESNTQIKNQTKDLIEGNSQQKLDNDQKLLASQQSINNTHNVKEDKPVIGNALGVEYPEGVSQESFTQNDENGLMKAIITRRVVVVEGHGDVYVRTQTTSATTYSKNGAPSSERVWQKETQGPHLIKNY